MVAFLRWSVLLFQLLGTSTWAAFGDYENHRLVDQSLVIQTTIGELSVTAIDDSAFEVHYRETGVAQLPSFALDDTRDPVAAEIRETGDNIEFITEGLTAVIGKSPVRVRFLKDGEALIEEEHGYYRHETLRGFRFSLDDDEKLLGGGQRVLGMDRRGRRMPLYNRAAYGYTTDDKDQMYFGLPAVLSSDKYIVVFDNSANGWLDIGASRDDILEFQAVAGRTAYLVVAGDSYPALVKNLTDVTGRQPLPPRWAFGNYASRFGYRSEQEVRDVVRRFRREKIPLDAVILDIYWFGPDVQGHMGNLDWDRESFPNAEDMIEDFAKDGVRTIPITEPFILTTSTNWQDAVDNDALAQDVTGGPRRFDFFFGNTGLVDVFNEHAQQWFWQFYERLFEQGIGGTWGDLGEPEVHPADSLHFVDGAGRQATADEVHNAYGHVWAQLVYENQARRYPAARPVILMRSGFIGSQRYGMMPWTGDVSRSWGGLKPQIELSLQMGMLGLAYNHSDLGGFAGGEAFDKEMYIRWLQYGVFQPIYRPHAQEDIAPEPVFHDRETRRIVRDFIRLRYRMLPYIYTLAYENSLQGTPLMRPLFFEDEDDLALIDEKYAYLWGDALLVAPVMDPGVESVSVPLPRGAWFDFWDDTRYEGGARVDVPVTLETIPVLVRAGSFVPMIEDIETTRDYSSERLKLHYYADATVTQSSGRMYDDDGETRGSLSGGLHEVLDFEAEHVGDSLAIDLSRRATFYDGMPKVREMTFVIHNWNTDTRTVNFDGRPVPARRKLPRRGDAYSYDEARDRLTIRVSWDHDPAALVINRDRE